MIASRATACASLVLLTAAAANAADWGTLTGRFVVEGELPPTRTVVGRNGAAFPNESLVVGPDGVLKNAVIYLRTRNVEVAPGYALTASDTVSIEVVSDRVEPHVAVLRTTQTLKLTNSSGVGLSPTLTLSINPGFSAALSPGNAITHKVANAESTPGKLNDSIHGWPLAWILPRDNPYAAVSAANGTFTIADLPADVELDFQLWHESVPTLNSLQVPGGVTDQAGRFQMKLKPGVNNLGDILVPAAMLRNK